jgi:hypothetical protein
MTIDHLVYGVPDLHAAIGELEARFGVRAEGAASTSGSARTTLC